MTEITALTPAQIRALIEWTPASRESADDEHPVFYCASDDCWAYATTRAGLAYQRHDARCKIAQRNAALEAFACLREREGATRAKMAALEALFWSVGEVHDPMKLSTYLRVVREEYEAARKVMLTPDPKG